MIDAWEYLHVNVGGKYVLKVNDKDPDKVPPTNSKGLPHNPEIGDFSNKLGSDGWELVTAYGDPNPLGNRMWIFKRRKA